MFNRGDCFNLPGWHKQLFNFMEGNGQAESLQHPRKECPRAIKARLKAWDKKKRYCFSLPGWHNRLFNFMEGNAQAESL